MKGLVILSVLLYTGAAFALPIEEPAVVEQPEAPAHRWTLVPDSEGRMHLVDMNPIDLEPEPSFNADRDVFYVLFTRRNTIIGQRISRTTASINGSNWITANQARFIIHGWTQDSRSSLNRDISRGYLDAQNHNVVVVDWGEGAGSINYMTSRNRVPATAQTIAGFIDWLHQNGFLRFADTIIAGHSLGAHIAGLTGKRVTRGRIQAIYGLDPAGPLFSMRSPNERLAEGDAVYTESIYTDRGGLGFDEPIAHGNFYPNWGNNQPGCLLATCDHDRSNLFYAESITSNRFRAVGCSGYSQIVWRTCNGSLGCIGSCGSGVMGGDTSKTLRGVFTLTTNRSSPFAQG